jgi:hypothetical protein
MRTNQKYLREERFAITVSKVHPKDYNEGQTERKEYILEADLYTNRWEQTPILYEAQTFSLSDACAITSVLNKINKCYFEILPIFEMQIFESKINTFPNE